MSIGQLCGLLIILNALYWAGYGVWVLRRWHRGAAWRHLAFSRWHARLAPDQARAFVCWWLTLSDARRAWVCTHFSPLWAVPLLWLITR